MSTTLKPLTVSESPLTLEDHVRQGVRLMEPMRYRWLVGYLITAAIVIALAGAIAAVWKWVPAESYVPAGVTLGAIAVMIIAMHLSGRRGTALEGAFDRWRVEAVRLLDPTAEYSAQDGPASSVFDQSGLNRSFYNRYSSWSGLTVGGLSCGALSVKHVYTETYYETEYYTDSNGQSQSRTVQKQRTVVIPIFDGMLVVVPAELPHKTWLLLPHGSDGIPDELNKLTVASPDLAKHYDIGASDSFAGFRALTPTLMESLWDYRTQFRSRPGFSYRDDLLYITIPNFFFDFGKRPGKWSVITTAKLQQTVAACKTSIDFVKETADRLKPT